MLGLATGGDPKSGILALCFVTAQFLSGLLDRGFPNIEMPDQLWKVKDNPKEGIDSPARVIDYNKDLPKAKGLR